MFNSARIIFFLPGPSASQIVMLAKTIASLVFAIKLADQNFAIAANKINIIFVCPLRLVA
jgi:hypothetical protein